MKKNKNSSFHICRKSTKKILNGETEPIQKMSTESLRKLVSELRLQHNKFKTRLETKDREFRNIQAKLNKSSLISSPLYNFSSIGCFSFNKTGYIKETDLIGATLIGTQKGKVVNKQLPFCSPDDKKNFSAHISMVFKTGNRQTCGVRLKKKNGQGFYAQLESIAVKDVKGKVRECMTALVKVIDKRKKAENSLVEVVGLAEGMAHDFNNILHSVTGFANLLKKRIKNKTVELRFVDNILIAAKRGSDLTKPLLTFSNQTENKNESTDVRTVLEKSTDILKHSIP